MELSLKIAVAVAAAGRETRTLQSDENNIVRLDTVRFEIQRSRLAARRAYSTDDRT